MLLIGKQDVCREKVQLRDELTKVQDVQWWEHLITALSHHAPVTDTFS